MLIDTHAHLTLPELASDLAGVLERASTAGVSGIVCVGIDLESSREAAEMARRHDRVAATVGVHPNDCASLSAGWLHELRALAAAPEVVAIGEIGLDYHRDRSPRGLQRSVFLSQLDLAAELRLPVVVHSRDAEGDTAEVLLRWASRLDGGQRRGVLHAFSGGVDTLKACCEAGFFVSFAGPVTFRNAGSVLETVAVAPANRLLLETDAPFLAPHPYRGRTNEPARLPLIARRVAEIRGETEETVYATTSANAANLFRPGFLPALDVRQ